MRGMRVIGVIPAYNEESSIADVLRACLPYLDRIVVVDDGSSDQTAQAAGLDGICVLQHPLNRGQGAALRTGTQAALKLGADVILHLDADGQHDPQNIPKMIEPIANGQADVVFGSRFLGIDPTGMPTGRRWLLRGIRLFNVMVLGIPKNMTDPQSGLRAMSAEAAQRINFHQDRMAHASEILRFVTRSDLRWQEVPAHIRYTEDSLRKGQKATNVFSIVWHLFVGLFTK